LFHARKSTLDEAFILNFDNLKQISDISSITYTTFGDHMMRYSAYSNNCIEYMSIQALGAPNVDYSISVAL